MIAFHSITPKEFPDIVDMIKIYSDVPSSSGGGGGSSSNNNNIDDDDYDDDDNVLNMCLEVLRLLLEMLEKKKKRKISVESGKQEPPLQLDVNNAPLSFGVIGSFEPRGRCNIRIIKGMARARGAFRGALLAKNQPCFHANKEASLAAAEGEDKQGRAHELENTEHEALN
ncbi:uncharacterized protein A4U43_UnF1270 [Asparagus officinalis]|uniref:Uncharacterized protein n=1 Tax=Asparagus officinalis TaxID=4686 RepID=A0A1R3L7K6_ASPOF|nr:uncharacterized protein A4U43_UnF1270 [Asparagus officinalis]